MLACSFMFQGLFNKMMTLLKSIFQNRPFPLLWYKKEVSAGHWRFCQTTNFTPEWQWAPIGHRLSCFFIVSGHSTPRQLFRKHHRFLSRTGDVPPIRKIPSTIDCTLLQGSSSDRDFLHFTYHANIRPERKKKILKYPTQYFKNAREKRDALSIELHSPVIVQWENSLVMKWIFSPRQHSFY